MNFENRTTEAQLFSELCSHDEQNLQKVRRCLLTSPCCCVSVTSRLISYDSEKAFETVLSLGRYVAQFACVTSRLVRHDGGDTLAILDTLGRHVATISAPAHSLQLSDILSENVTGAQRRDKIVELALILLRLRSAGSADADLPAAASLSLGFYLKFQS